MEKKIATRINIDRHNQIPLYILLGISLALIVPIALIAYLGTFTRFHADDFCVVGMVSRIGFLDGVKFWYMTWTGRFAFTFFSQLFGLGGPQFSRFFPALLIAAWLLSLTWLIFSILKLIANHPSKKSTDSLFLPFSLVLSTSTLAALFHLLPNLFQSILWQSGAINYSLPLVFLTTILSVILDTIRVKLENPSRQIYVRLLTILGLSILASGFSEVFTVVLFSIYGASLAYALLKKLKTLSQTLSVGLLGNVAGLTLVITAPGNVIRQQTVDISHPNLIELLSTVINNAYITGHAMLKHHWFEAVILLLLCISASYISFTYFAPRTKTENNLVLVVKKIGIIFFVVILVCFVLVTISMVPAEFFLRTYPDARALTIPLFMIVVSVVVFGAAVGYQVSTFTSASNAKLIRFFTITALLAAIVLSADVTSQKIQLVPENRSYAALWDNRDAQMVSAKEQGLQSIAAPGLPIRYGVHDLAHDPNNWVNRCVAWFYGFRTVVGK